MKFSLPSFALRRPVTVVMLAVSIFALGMIAWFKMPLNFLPRVDQPFIGVSIPYPGASPEQVEQQVAIPVEGEFRTIPGLERIRTISNSDGCFVSMQYNLDTDMTTATAEVRDRIERLKLVLPEDVDRMLIQRFSSRSIPVMAVGVFSSGEEQEFIHLVRTLIEPRIRRQEGVADVEILTPVPEKEVLIEFEQSTLLSMNVDLAEIIAILQQSSLNVSVGQLLDGDEKSLVRLLGEYRHLDEIANLIISPTGTRLKEVATVRFASRDEQAHVSLDGKAGAVIMVTKESEANTVATCINVRAELERIQAEPIFEEMTARVFFDQADLITRALNNLFMQGIYGGVMAVGVLFIFLHRFRPTIIVALAIPSSLLVALVGMYFTGMSLNIVTMVSMIIAVGMLVDNAIVVVENTIRHRQLGESPEDSARIGASEVGLAIFASTATTWVVFVPMYYLETGRMSVFMEQLGFPLVVSLLGSLIGALTLVPLAMSRMKDSKHSNLFLRIEAALGLLPGMPEAQKPRGALGLLGRLKPVQTIIGIYARIMAMAIRWRIASLMLLGLVIYATYAIPYQAVGMRDLPKLDTREVKIDVELEQNFTMQMANAYFVQLEHWIDEWREELGVKSVMTFYELGGGVVQIYLYTEDDGPEWVDPPFDTEQVMRIVSERLPARLPGAELSFTVTETGESGSEAAITVRMRGDDTSLLNQYAELFKARMQAIPSISDVTTDLERDKQEMQLRIDEPLADQYGLTPMAIATTVDAALRGARMPFLKEGGREIPVWAQFREEDRKSRANLDNISIKNLEGDQVALNQLVEYERALSSSSIHRVDGKNVVTLTAKAETKNMSQIMNDLQRAADEFYLPVGYNIQLGDQLLELDENIFQFASSLLLAIVLIYIVMAALFESFVLPFSILTTVPLSLGGAVWMLYFTNTQMDTVTMIGCILMAGVIVNNGIVIVDHINQLRKDGLTRTEAIVQAGQNRFRPVMMTAITTILGLVPLAMAQTGGAATFAGLGRALVGGMTVGTILTLVVVPLFYSLIDDIQVNTVGFISGFRRTFRGEARETGEVSSEA